MNSSHLLPRMKHFVTSSENKSSVCTVDEKTINVSNTTFISGCEVKQFYEETVGEKSSITKHLVKEINDTLVNKSKLQKNTTKKQININLFMKSIEIGDTKDVVAILESNADIINCQDQFGWTPLMAACCAGNLFMVELLLQWGPNLSIRDKQGNTCRTLALSKGHRNIVSAIDKYVRESRVIKLFTPEPEPENPAPFFCKTCKLTIENSTYKKHLSSTIHNFHTSSSRKMPTMYGIPESNKGFQILVRSGWNKEDGLGPSGEGHKFPPKTILKQDKSGLGAKKYTARVTHSLEDVRREAKPKDTFKRKLKTQIIKEKRHERSIRRMLS